MSMHKFRMILTSIAAGALIYACEPAPDRPAEPAKPATASVAATPGACKLVMGWDPWEPYHYRDIGGEVRGLDIELVAAIARTAGCELRFDQED